MSSKKHFLPDEYVEDCIIDKNNIAFIKQYLDDLFGRLFLYKKDVIYIDERTNTFAAINKNDLSNFVFSEENIGIFWNIKKSAKEDENADEENNNDKKKKIERYVDVDKIFSYAKLNRLDNIVFEGVLYDDEKIELDIKRRTLYVRLKNILINDREKREIDENIKSEIIADYKEHFPQIDEFLEFILACRFTHNRKRSFLYLNAPSDWGKSFLMNIFKKVGLGLEVDYSDVIGGRPVGLSAMNVLKSLVLFLDEFTVFKKELKKITHTLFVEEKFMPKVEVEVYAKVLMSAEKSVSFTDTVETQIVNRIIMFEIDKNAKILTERDVYKKYGNLMYFTAVKQYCIEYLINRINYYLSKDEFKADREAENLLNQMFEKYKLDEIDLETYLIQFFADSLSELVLIKNDSDDDELDFETKKLLKYIDTHQNDKNIVYINNFSKFVDDLFKIKLDESKYKSASYKKTQLAQILFDADKISDVTKVKRIDKQNKKVVEVIISDLYFKYITKTKVFEYENEKIRFSDFAELAVILNEKIKDYFEISAFDKINKLVEYIKNYGLLRVFTLVKEKNQIIGIECETVSPNVSEEDEFFPF